MYTQILIEFHFSIKLTNFLGVQTSSDFTEEVDSKKTTIEMRRVNTRTGPKNYSSLMS